MTSLPYFQDKGDNIVTNDENVTIQDINSSNLSTDISFSKKLEKEKEKIVHTNPCCSIDFFIRST